MSHHFTITLLIITFTITVIMVTILFILFAAISADVAGRGIGWTDGSDTSDIVIPVVEAGFDNQTTIAKMNSGTLTFLVNIKPGI